MVVSIESLSTMEPLERKPRVLDLFCGLGGFHQSFVDCHVDTLDNDPDLKPTFLGDIRHFQTSEYYDIVLAAPPCEDFSRWSVRGMNPHLRKNPPPIPTTELTEEVLRIIKEVKPAVWIVECVRGSVSFLTPLFGKKPYFCCSRYFWTNLEVDQAMLKLIKLPLKKRYWGGISKSKKAYLLKSKIEPEISSYFYNASISFLNSSKENKTTTKLEWQPQPHSLTP